MIWAISFRIFAVYVKDRAFVFRTFLELYVRGWCLCLWSLTVRKNNTWHNQNWKQSPLKGKKPGKVPYWGDSRKCDLLACDWPKSKGAFQDYWHQSREEKWRIPGQILANQKRRISAGFSENRGFHRKKQLRAVLFGPCLWYFCARNSENEQSGRIRRSFTRRFKYSAFEFQGVKR